MPSVALSEGCALDMSHSCIHSGKPFGVPFDKPFGVPFDKPFGVLLGLPLDKPPLQALRKTFRQARLQALSLLRGKENIYLL
jgi:hypothetical protein